MIYRWELFKWWAWKQLPWGPTYYGNHYEAMPFSAWFMRTIMKNKKKWPDWYRLTVCPPISQEDNKAIIAYLESRYGGTWVEVVEKDQ